MYLKKLQEIVNRDDLNVFDATEYKDNQTESIRFKNNYAEANIYSVSKSFTATAIGILADDGLIRLDDKVLKFFKDELPDNIDEKFKYLTISHLITHQTGLENGYLFEGDIINLDSDDYVNIILSLPLKYNPGTKAVYTNTGYYLASVIVEKITKKKTFDFLRERLFSPLKFKLASWSECPKGHSFGASSLHLRLADMLKLGILYLNKGVYGGIRYLSESWCEDSCKVRTHMNGQGYSLGFWHTSVDGIFYCSGAWGQIILIDTIHNCVLAFRSFDGFNQLMLIEELIKNSK